MSELTTAPARRRRKYVPPDELLPLFQSVAHYRALTVPHAHHLVLANFEGGRTMRATRYRLQNLATHGFLDVVSIPARPPVRLFHLTRSSFARWPSLETLVTDHTRKPPVPDVAIHAWNRAALAVAARAAGYETGRDLRALTALRRSLVDRQTAAVHAAPDRLRPQLERILQQLRALPLIQPWTVEACEACGVELPIPWDGQERKKDRAKFCEECGGALRQHVVATPHECGRCGVRSERGGEHVVEGVPCPGTLRLVDYLPFDLAWKRTPQGYEVQILFADNPFRSLQTQLAELPLRIIGQPRMDIVVRPSDDGSEFDRVSQTFQVRGPRYRALLRAFSEASAKADAFPFWTTASVASDAVYPEAHFRVVTTNERESQ